MMEFIIERQEVFADNMDKADKRMSRFERGFVALFDFHNETARMQRELTESNKELREAQKHTDEKLNVLVDVVERFITEKRNGRKRNGNKRSSKRNSRG